MMAEGGRASASKEGGPLPPHNEWRPKSTVLPHDIFCAISQVTVHSSHINSTYRYRATHHAFRDEFQESFPPTSPAEV